MRHAKIIVPVLALLAGIAIGMTIPRTQGDSPSRETPGESPHGPTVVIVTDPNVGGRGLVWTRGQGDQRQITYTFPTADRSERALRLIFEAMADEIGPDSGRDRHPE